MTERESGLLPKPTEAGRRFCFLGILALNTGTAGAYSAARFAVRVFTLADAANAATEPLARSERLNRRDKIPPIFLNATLIATGATSTGMISARTNTPWNIGSGC